MDRAFKMKGVMCCFLFAMLVLVMGLPIRRGGVAWRTSSTAVVGGSTPAVAWGKSPPTALCVMSVDAGTDSNNASSWTQRMAGGDGEPVSRVDYLVNNAESRLRDDQKVVFSSLVAIISTVNDNVKDLGSKVNGDVKGLSSKLDSTTENIAAMKIQMFLTNFILFIIVSALASQNAALLNFSGFGPEVGTSEVTS